MAQNKIALDSLNNIFGLNGKIGFVTGAASGLGIEFIQALSLAGADVVLADIDTEGAERVAEKVRKLGRKAIVVHLDVSKEDQVQQAVDKAVAEFGRIDILFNNAGIADPVPALLHEYSTENWHKVIDIDLHGVFYLSKAVLKVMVKQGSGKIINIASIWGLAGASSVFPIPAYNAAKGAVVNLTRELGLQYAKIGINVNAICPGFYRTNLAGGAYDNKDFVDAVTTFTPMGRVADADEIRGPALFLASAASNYMTGQTLVVDGGCLAK